MNSINSAVGWLITVLVYLLVVPPIRSALRSQMSDASQPIGGCGDLRADRAESGPRVNGAPGEPIRLLIADDHPVVRDGLTGMFAADPDFFVVGEAADGSQAVWLAEAIGPDVILMDLRTAARLFISEATVKTHLVHIYAKLGVTDRAAAVAVAFNRGLLAPVKPERH